MRRWLIIPIALALYVYLLHIIGLTFLLGAWYYYQPIEPQTFYWSELIDVINPIGVAYTWPVLLVMLIAQAFILWPVRRFHQGRVESGRVIWPSLLALGFVLGLLCLALLAAIVDVGHYYYNWQSSWADLFGEDGFFKAHVTGVTGPILATSWTIWTVLLWLFIQGGRTRESTISRLLGLLFAGSMIELALVIPADVVVRRRESCYCETGTFYAIMVTGCIALFTMGPLCVLMVLTKHRRAFYRSHCPACGYAKGPVTRRPDRCPECGAKWKAPADPA